MNFDTFFYGLPTVVTTDRYTKLNYESHTERIAWQKFIL
jgi:hypothetical protein